MAALQGSVVAIEPVDLGPKNIFPFSAAVTSCILALRIVQMYRNTGGYSTKHLTRRFGIDAGLRSGWSQVGKELQDVH